MLEIGKMNRLYVYNENKKNYILRAPNYDVDVELPKSEATELVNQGDILEVFVYVDNNDKEVASITRPVALLDEFAVVKVVESHQFGAFVDWGLSKDLLVPDTEQKERMGNNRFYIVRVCLDERTNKLYGTTKIGKYIPESQFDIGEGDKIEIIPASYEELGYRSLINRKFIGMIYHNEIFQKIEIGTPVSGVVKKIRNDGLVDAALQVQGFKNIEDSQKVVLEFLRANGGKTSLHDKSSPEEIREKLGMSKKTFKNAIGMLYKERRIVIHKDGIELK